MNPLLSATQPCFGAISQIRQLDPSSLSSPQDLQRRLCGFIEEMRTRLGSTGLPAQDVQDITYAVVALADEAALNAAESLASYWMMNLLQFKYFQENTAGDGFFARLNEIRKRGRKEALRIYTLCLVFGFQGKYRVRGGELELLTLVESLQREVLPASGEGEPLSPHAQRPAETLSRARGNLPFIAAAVGAVGVALVLYGAQRIVLSRSMSALESDIAAVPHP